MYVIAKAEGLQQLKGIVTSISPMTIPPQETPTVVKKFHDNTIIVIVICVMFGILLGIVSAFLCHYHTYVPWLRAIADGGQGIALQTLSYGIVPDLDIAESYERAMQARHVGHCHNLTIIDPSEIVLHSIIGEGSFGRVWSAMWQSSQVAVRYDRHHTQPLQPSPMTTPTLPLQPSHHHTVYNTTTPTTR